jgi:N-acylneuraminate cytidylyltransferase
VEQPSSDNPLEILAVIPARGGSKGIPGKNLLPIGGLPLVARSVLAARHAGRVTRVVVSTDDPGIEQIARQYQADVVQRPAAISGDRASSESALLHVLDVLRETEDYHPDLLVFLQCTSPLTEPEDIDGTIGTLIDRQADSALAAVPFHYFLWKENADGSADGVDHDKSVRPMRQDRQPEYLEAGSVYVMRTEGFRRAEHRFFGKTVLHPTPARRRWEIDEPADLPIAEAMARTNEKLDAADRLPPRPAGLVFDFDGVFTDNKVWVTQEGLEAVACDRRDGMGISHLRRTGLPMLVLSSEVNPVVMARCKKLQLDCLHGHQTKLGALTDWMASNDLPAERVIYVGNDINDVDCMGAVGCPVAVADATEPARSAARIILHSNGGNGAVREVTDMILQKLGAQ